ncbi:CRISPR-associated RAMP protein Csx7 [Sulfidibacter corallicola]|uniref:CRISPR-associated RAMP protein n=1 Tax=Sulfidibacter corallicola TaxID=2818388 RepID=A0A8A4TT93_SULCO|nr:CRISPR-associated RAMP protein Csx7 [Sulfidibacter corallicola]QTD49765.1 CRISPR-associated RAMP protein [Sulfidibacter corallicola]
MNRQASNVGRHHAAIGRIVHFKLRITTRSGLHIGAGKNQGLSGSDLPVIRDAEGCAMIPGSSLRGVLRAGIESLCVGLGQASYPEHRNTRERGDGPRGSYDLETFHELWEELDLVERLFGVASGASYGSRVQFSDLMSVDPSQCRLEIRDGVAIDRETRTVRGAGKFDKEVVQAGAVFEGRIRMLNPSDVEIGLIAQSLWMLDEGFLLLGGKKARGLGWVAVSVASLVDQTARDILAGLPPSDSKAFTSVTETFDLHLTKLREAFASTSERM